MLYETDYYSWTQQQAALLRDGKLDELDVINLLEEVEDMGKSQRNQLENRLKQLLLHLLKWRYQPLMKTHSWKYSIIEQRFKVARVIKENPGLKPQIPDLLWAAYVLARLGAAKQTSMDITIFPEECPWTFEQVVDDGFFPD